MTGLLAILARPKVAAGVLAGLALIALVAAYELRLRGARADAAEARAELAAEQRRAAEFQAAIAEISSNRDALAAEVDRQNAAVEALRAELSRAAEGADLRAVREIRAGEARRREILASPEIGPESLNDWLRSAFGADR